MATLPARQRLSYLCETAKALGDYGEKRQASSSWETWPDLLFALHLVHAANAQLCLTQSVLRAVNAGSFRTTGDGDIFELALRP